MIGAVATLGAAGLSAASAYAINQANIRANQDRWSDEINLANTQHQREVADLRLAGLNPILSTGTAGAAVPSQSAVAQTNPLSDVSRGVSSAFSEYMSRKVAKEQLNALREEVKGLQKDNRLKDASISMANREDWLQGLGIDDLREWDSIQPIGTPDDKLARDLVDISDMNKLRKLYREGYLSEAAVKARTNGRTWYKDVLEGINTGKNLFDAVNSWRNPYKPYKSRYYK